MTHKIKNSVTMHIHMESTMPALQNGCPFFPSGVAAAASAIPVAFNFLWYSYDKNIVMINKYRDRLNACCNWAGIIPIPVLP